MMAGFAGNAAGMLLGVYLREALGFGGARRMTTDAEDCGVELWGSERRRSVDRHCIYVLLQRTVAGFAVDGHVLAGGFGGENVGVAGLAGLVTGEVDRAGGHLADSGAAIVAVLSEALGHDKVTNDEEGREGDDEEKSKSEKMS